MTTARTVLDMAPRRVLEQVQSDLGLSDAELATALDATPRTIERWRTGMSYPQIEQRRRLGKLLELTRQLRETFTTPEAIRTWLRAPNRYLGGLTPADAVRVGRIDRAEAALEALATGVFL